MSRMVGRVDGRVKRELRRLRCRTKDKGLAARCQIVLLWGDGETRASIARAVGCSISWVGRVVGRFLDHGIAGLHDRREDNGQLKLDEKFLATLRRIVSQQPDDFGYPRPTWTQELLVLVMADLTGVKVHVGTMSRALKQIGARLGRPKPTVGCPWPAAAKNKRLEEVRQAVQGKGPEDSAFYLDEVDVHLNPKIGPDWMNRGEQKVVVTPGQNAKQYVCGALDDRSGLIEYVTGERKNSLLFLSMLERLLEARPTGLIHVVLDNFKIHSSRQVEAWMTQHGDRIRLHFLPPYCPDHNKIERKWLDLHASVTRNHRCPTMEELMTEVERWLKARNRECERKRYERAA